MVTAAASVTKTSASVLLPVPEAARLLRVSPRYLRTLVSRGDLPVVRLGRRVLIARSDLDALVAANRAPAVTAPRRRPAIRPAVTGGAPR
ncbi:MAG: helix-turn-helix domain-containing protein [Acidimicrobiales bacterium]